MSRNWSNLVFTTDSFSEELILKMSNVKNVIRNISKNLSFCFWYAFTMNLRTDTLSLPI